MSVIEIPLLGGVREDIAKDLLPGGTLRRVENFRATKEGELTPRTNYHHSATYPAEGFKPHPSESAALYICRLAEYQGQQLAYSEENVADSEYPGDDYALHLRRESADYFWAKCLHKNGDKPAPFCTAPLAEWRARTSVETQHPSIGIVGGVTLLAWIDSDTIGYEIRDPDGGVWERDDAWSGASTAAEVLVLPLGTRLLLIWRVAGSLFQDYVETSPAGGMTSGSTLETGLATADPAWDAVSDGTTLTIAFYDDTGAVQVNTYDSSLTPVTTDTVAATVADKGLAIGRDSANGDTILAFNEAGSGLQAITWDGSPVSGNRSATFVLDASIAYNGPIAVSCDATGDWVAWASKETPTGYGAASACWTTRFCSINVVAGSKGSIIDHYRSRPISKPRNGFLWLHYGRSFSTERQYLLMQYDSDHLNLVARSGMRVAAAAYGYEHSLPLGDQAYEDGELYWAAREVYDGELTFTNTTTALIGVVAYRYSLTSPKRAAVTELRGLHFSGGTHRLWDGALVTDPPHGSPEADDSWLSNSGAGLLDGTASYRVVYVAHDGAGNVWRSAPSATVSIAGLSSNEVTIRIESLGFDGYRGEVYRRHTDGTYRFVADVELTAASASADVVDTGLSISDSTLLYTAGGEAESFPTPPNDCGALWNRRLWVAADDQLYYSHAYDFADGRNLGSWMVESQYVQFEDRITGLAPLDTALLVFTATTVHALTGEGPNRRGDNPYQNPQRISSEVGCADWRSVVGFRDGVAFRSARGFELIPRGAYSVQPFGDPIEDTAADYTQTTSAIARPEHDQIRWTLRGASDGRVVAFDYVAKLWTTETAPAYDTAIAWAPGYAVASNTAVMPGAAAGGGMWQQTSSIVRTDDTGSGSNTFSWTPVFETGEIRSAGVAGWQRVRSVDLVGSLLAGNTYIEIAVAMDGQEEFIDAGTDHHVGIRSDGTSEVVMDPADLTQSLLTVGAGNVVTESDDSLAGGVFDELDLTNWNQVGTATTGTDPYTVTEDSSTGAHRIYLYTYVTTEPLSVIAFVKRATGSTRNLRISIGSSPDSDYIDFDLDAITASITGAVQGNISGPDSDGRYRVGIYSAGHGSFPNVYVQLMSGASVSYTGDGSSAIVVEALDGYVPMFHQLYWTPGSGGFPALWTTSFGSVFVDWRLSKCDLERGWRLVANNDTAVAIVTRDGVQSQTGCTCEYYDLGGNRVRLIFSFDATAGTTQPIRLYTVKDPWYENVYEGDGRDVFTVDRVSLSGGYSSNFGDAFSSEFLGAQAGDPVRQRFSPPQQKCESLRVRVRFVPVDENGSATAGATVSALRLETTPKRKPGRIQPGFRS